MIVLHAGAIGEDPVVWGETLESEASPGPKRRGRPPGEVLEQAPAHD